MDDSVPARTTGYRAGDARMCARAPCLPPQDAQSQPPASASVTAEAITSRLPPDQGEIVTSEETQRTLTGPGGQSTTIHDVVVRATRRG